MHMAGKLVCHSIAPSISRNYTGAVNRYEAFCVDYELVSFPPAEGALIMFVTYLASYSSYSNVKLHMSAIKHFALRRNVFAELHKFQQLFLVLKGIKRLNRHKKPKRAPVTPSLLRSMRAHLFNSGKHFSDKVTLWAALLTAFFGFLRVSEYTSSHKTKFDPETTLLVSDVGFTDT